jgi:hypothetical protein
MRSGSWEWGAAVASAIVYALIGTVIGSADAAAPKNTANEYLLRLKPEARAAWFARTVGEWCIATEPFEMGVSETGPSTGNAYWSFRCVNGGSYVVQLDRAGHGVAIDCETFKKDGAGKECFKKF